jgi:sulfide:quinone oxidoreductase
MLLQHRFKLGGLAKRTRISLFTVEPNPVPTAGSQMSKLLREALDARTIQLQTNKRTKSVDSNKRQVVFEDGTEVSYDLLIAVPPHEAPQAVRASGLVNASGWIPVDPRSLKTSADRVYAIGDVTVVSLPGRYRPDVPLALPKAAVFADSHARIAAANIAASILGKDTSAAFDGKGFCFVEMGDRHAMGGEGAFFELPQPRVEPRVPDMNQFEEKLQWVQKWMDENLGR